MGLDHWAIARCVSVSEGTVRRAGSAYHLPVSIKFQLISPCWCIARYCTDVEANKWADAPTEFDEFTLDGGELEGAGDSVVVTNGGSILLPMRLSALRRRLAPCNSHHAIHNVCQITWTGTLAEEQDAHHQLRRKSVLNNYNAAYSGLSFGASASYSRMVHLGTGRQYHHGLTRAGEPNPVVTFPFRPWTDNAVWANVRIVEWRAQNSGHWSCCHSATNGLTGLDRFRLPFPASGSATWCSHGIHQNLRHG